MKNNYRFPIQLIPILDLSTKMMKDAYLSEQRARNFRLKENHRSLSLKWVHQQAAKLSFWITTLFQVLLTTHSQLPTTTDAEVCISGFSYPPKPKDHVYPRTVHASLSNSQHSQTPLDPWHSMLLCSQSYLQIEAPLTCVMKYWISRNVMIKAQDIKLDC